MHYLAECPSPLGTVTLASDGENLTGLWLEGQMYYGQTIPKEAQWSGVPVFDKTKKWLEKYFAGKNPAMTLPLAPLGSDFRHVVWKILLAIPYGGVTTYGDIARDMARAAGLSSMSAQAVGGAVGHNPISIIIPCHRVVGHDGGLTGYAGGIDKKRWLLRLEKAAVPGLE